MKLRFKKRYLGCPQRKTLGRFLLSLDTERLILSRETGTAAQLEVTGQGWAGEWSGRLAPFVLELVVGIV